MLFVGQKEKLATFAVRYYSYTGGPHGVGGNVYLTVDMTTHKSSNAFRYYWSEKTPWS